MVLLQFVCLVGLRIFLLDYVEKRALEKCMQKEDRKVYQVLCVCFQVVVF